MKNGMVAVDSEFAKSIGFTSDKFDGYGWIKGRDYWVSVIMSRQPSKGHLRAMIQALLDKGYTVKVPTPFARMHAILTRLGFKETWERDEDLGESFTVMVKQP